MAQLQSPRLTGLSLHERTLVAGGFRVETLSGLSPEEALAFVRAITDRNRTDVVPQLIKDGFVTSEHAGPQLREVRDWLRWHTATKREGLVGFLPHEGSTNSEVLKLDIEGAMCGVVTCEHFPRLNLAHGRSANVLLRATEVVTPQSRKNAKDYAEQNGLPKGSVNPRMLLGSSVTALAQNLGANLLIAEEVRSGSWCGSRANHLEGCLFKQGYRLLHGAVRVGNETRRAVVPWIRPDDFPESDYQGDPAAFALANRANNLYIRPLNGQRLISGRDVCALFESLTDSMWPDSRYFTRSDKDAAIDAMQRCVNPSEMYAFRRLR